MIPTTYAHINKYTNTLLLRLPASPHLPVSDSWTTPHHHSFPTWTSLRHTTTIANNSHARHRSLYYSPESPTHSRCCSDAWIHPLELQAHRQSPESSRTSTYMQRWCRWCPLRCPPPSQTTNTTKTRSQHRHRLSLACSFVHSPVAAGWDASWRRPPDRAHWSAHPPIPRSQAECRSRARVDRSRWRTTGSSEDAEWSDAMHRGRRTPPTRSREERWRRARVRWWTSAGVVLAHVFLVCIDTDGSRLDSAWWLLSYGE